MLEQIKVVLDERVRPFLKEHGGDVSVIGYEDGVLQLKLLGQCAGCPAASLTNEMIIQEEVTKAVPEVKRVMLVQGVSDELMAEARRLMTHGHSPDR